MAETFVQNGFDARHTRSLRASNERHDRAGARFSDRPLLFEPLQLSSSRSMLGPSHRQVSIRSCNTNAIASLSAGIIARAHVSNRRTAIQ